MASIMVKNGFIVTMDRSDRLLLDGAIYIEGPKIVDIGKTQDLEKTYKADEVIDASNSVVMPGLVNSHAHFTSVLRRGVEDDLPLEQWLGTLRPHPTELVSKEELAAVFRLVCLEMIKAGITCYSAGSGMLSERYESGLRGLHSFLVTDEIGDYESVLQCIQKDYSDRFHFGFWTPWLPSVPEDVMVEMKEIAQKRNLKIHMHVAESRGEIREIKRKYGCDGPIQYLNQLGLLSPRLIAAHCPVSNAKLGDGIAPLVDFQRAEITVGLGSDGPATNNCISMFQEMKYACLQRAVYCDPRVVKAEDVLRMATIGGAKLLGMDSEIGSIEIGKRADVIVVDFEKPHLYPRTDIISHFVYSAKASDVDTTIVDGKVIMRNRKVLTMNEAEVLQKTQEVYESVSS